MREGPVTATPRLAQRDEVEFDIAGLLRRARIRFFVNVCEFHLRWSVFHHPLLQCAHAELFRLFFELGQLTCDLCELWEQQLFLKFTEQQEWDLGFRSHVVEKISALAYQNTQLRERRQAAGPLGPMSSGRVPRGVSEYCSCQGRAARSSGERQRARRNLLL